MRYRSSFNLMHVFTNHAQYSDGKNTLFLDLTLLERIPKTVFVEVSDVVEISNEVPPEEPPATADEEEES